jgi:protein transport protein SEC13
MATCGSEGKIVIYDVANNNFKIVSELIKHESSVWKVSWAHSRFGNIIASCGFDKKVFIWKEITKNKWEIIYEYSHQQSVNCIAFSPQEYGLILVSVSSDNTICIHDYDSKKLNYT